MKGRRLLVQHPRGDLSAEAIWSTDQSCTGLIARVLEQLELPAVKRVEWVVNPDVQTYGIVMDRAIREFVIKPAIGSRSA